MKYAVIKYKRFGFPIIKKLAVPENWNELTPRQFRLVCKVLSYCSTVRDLSVNDVAGKASQFAIRSKLLVCKSFFGLRRWQYKCIMPDQWYDLLESVDWVFSGKIDLSSQKMPSFRLFFRRYFGPKDQFKVETFEEVTMADTYALKYMKTGESVFLDALTAVLYRPKKGLFKLRNRATSSRVAIDEISVDRRTRLFSKYLPQYRKQAALFMYLGFRSEVIMDEFSDLFGVGESSKSGNDFGWFGVQLAMAGGKFGALKETLNTPWKSVFYHLMIEKDNMDRLKSNSPIKSKA